VLWIEEHNQYVIWTLDNEEDVRSGEQPINPVILETSNLTKCYGDWRSSAVDFDVARKKMARDGNPGNG
jgi:hypothetical protein